MPKDRRFLLTTGVLVLIAFLLRAFRIGAQELWIDEAYSYLLAAQPDWFGPATLANNTPPLYHFLLRAWMRLAGEDEAGLRLLSALFGTLMVVAVIWTGRELFSPAVGLWSGGFAAIAPFHIYYSQEARSYAMLALALTLTYWMVARATRVNTLLSWALVTASAVLALYSHYFAVLGLLPTALLVWALSWTGHPVWRRYLAAVGIAALLFLPWGFATFFLAPHPLQDPSADWMRVNWQNIPPALAIPKSFEMLGLGGHAGFSPVLLKQFRSMEFPLWARLAGLTAIYALFVWAMVPQGDDLLGIPGLHRRKACLIALLLFPLVALWMASHLVTPLYIVGRYDILGFPAYCFMVGLGLAKLQCVPRKGLALAAGLCGLLIVSIVTKLTHYYQAPSPALTQNNVRILNGALQNGDVAVFTDPAVHAYLYYLGRLGYRWRTGECRNEEAKRWFYCRFLPVEAEPTLHGISGRTLSIQDTRAELQKILASLRDGTSTVWIISGPTRTEESDAIVFGQLARLGFDPIPKASSPPLFAFRRALPPPEAATLK